MAEGIPIDWTATAEQIAELVEQHSESPPFSYLKGARVELLGARPDKSRPEAEPGTIVEAGDNGEFRVATTSGSVIVTRYHIRFYVHETNVLMRMLDAFELVLPQRLGAVPFLDNRDATSWEKAVRRWGRAKVDWRTHEFEPGRQHPTVGLIDANVPYFRWLFNALQIRPDGVCLDIGCADGWAMETFTRLGRRAAGFDVSDGGLAIARRHIRDAVIDELDYYEAGRHYASTGAEFDFMLCRNLGIAQKVVDWSEPSWIAATADLATTLRPEGVLWWSQLSDRTGQMGSEGFSNTPASVLLEYFRKAGLRCLSMNVFGAIFVLLLVRPEYPEVRSKRFHAMNEAIWRGAFDRYRAEVKRPPTGMAIAPRETIADGFRAACGLLSRMLVKPPVVPRLIIAGTDSVAQLFGRAALLLRIPVVAYWTPAAHISEPGFDAPIRHIGDCLDQVQQPAVLVADPDLEHAAVHSGAERVISPWHTDVAVARRVYLISGDQDEAVLDGVRAYMAGFADWVPPASNGHDAPVVTPQSSEGLERVTLPRETAVEYAIEPDAEAEMAIPAPNLPDHEKRDTDPEPRRQALPPVRRTIDDLLPAWTSRGDGQAAVRLDAVATIGLAGQEITFRKLSTVPATLRFMAVRRSGDVTDCRAAITDGAIGVTLVLEPSGVSLWTTGRDVLVTQWPRWAHFMPTQRPSGAAPLDTSGWHSYEISLDAAKAAVAVDGTVLLSATLTRQVKNNVHAVFGVWKSSADSEVEWREVRLEEIANS